MGRTVNGATSPDTPQRRNSVVKHVFRHDKSSFAVFRRLLGIYKDRDRKAFHDIYGPHSLMFMFTAK